MKNKHSNILTSRWLRLCFLLALVFSGQVYSFYHSIHFHEKSSIESDLQLSAVELEHSSGHHHHDRTRSHSDDHRHSYDMRIDWHIIRTQSQNTLAVDYQYFFSSIPFDLTDDTKSTYFDLEKLLFLDEYHASFSAIRGPPLRG